MTTNLYLSEVCATKYFHCGFLWYSIDVDQSRIGAVIVQLVDEHGVTQKSVAEAAGIDPSRLSKLLSGREGVWLKAPQRKAIAKHFGLTLAAFDSRVESSGVSDDAPAHVADGDPKPRVPAGSTGAYIQDPPTIAGQSVEVIGDSMDPALKHGDCVKVRPVDSEDQSTLLHAGAIVLVETDDHIRAWYRWQPAAQGKVDLLKDNEQYPARKGVTAIGDSPEIVAVAVPVELHRKWVR